MNSRSVFTTQNSDEYSPDYGAIVVMICNLFCFQSDLVNQSLYNFTHADERMKIYQLLSQHKVVPGNGVPDYEMGKSIEK